MSTAVGAGAYLHHMQLESRDPSALARFYADAMDMVPRQLANGDWLCEGPLRRMLFTTGRDKVLGYGAFACRDAEGITFYPRVSNSSWLRTPAPTPPHNIPKARLPPRGFRAFRHQRRPAPPGGTGASSRRASPSLGRNPPDRPPVPL